MEPDKALTYLVIENAPDVCEGIIERMKPFTDWTSLGYCTGIKAALQKLEEARPALLFMDWSLNGGSAYELLQQIQNTPGYDPYVIFNTGFQKDNPEIPQEILNNYRVDKYLIKPIWENLRGHLPVYLEEARLKARPGDQKADRQIWLEDNNGAKRLVSLARLVCITQDALLPRCRNFYFSEKGAPLCIALSWLACCELLEEHHVDYYIAKSRSHLVVKDYIAAFEKPFIRLKGFARKFEVVRENISDFEAWLMQHDLPGIPTKE